MQHIRQIFLTAIALLLASLAGQAQNWDNIRSSGEYYYGVGVGATEAEASEVAMADLVSMIATHVSSEFVGIEDESNTNGKIDHKTRVLNCVRTYSQSTLTNVQKWVLGKAPNITVRRYMKRSELARIYESRIAKAKDMVNIAGEAKKKGKIDMALQYYYWAYSLIRSVQRPNEVTGEGGRILMNWIPLRINEILSEVNVKFDHRDGDFVDLLFTYRGQPVSSVEFNYNDGRKICQGSAKDGRGTLEMVPGYETSTYHVSLEYEYTGQARGDAEMQSVLEVITRKPFPKAVHKVKDRGSKAAQPRKDLTITASGRPATAVKSDGTGINLNPSASQIVAQSDTFVATMNEVIAAIQRRSYSDANRCFTLDGLGIYNKLISYGTGRIVGTPNISFFKGTNGTVVARGLQMSFSFKSGTKKTYVEDVVFTFNTDGRIENVAFGLGQVAENDILCKYAPGWSDETREVLMEFMENYKTAYCLKRLDYISDIFADDAVIISGNVLKRTDKSANPADDNISEVGREIIQYNRYTKDAYIKRLKETFARNEFINIRFSNNEVQWLEKYKDKKLFAIQIGQEYNSSRYADKGFLFLLVDMTDREAPQIKVRTWQPNQVSMDKLYNAGDFTRE